MSLIDWTDAQTYRSPCIYFRPESMMTVTTTMDHEEATLLTILAKEEMSTLTMAVDTTTTIDMMDEVRRKIVASVNIPISLLLVVHHHLEPHQGRPPVATEVKVVTPIGGATLFLSGIRAWSSTICM